jgi:hypothetical protein
MTEKVLDRKIGRDQSVPKDLVVRDRILRDGAIHEHLVPTANASLAENGSPIHTSPATKTSSEGRALRAFRGSNSS